MSQPIRTDQTHTVSAAAWRSCCRAGFAIAAFFFTACAPKVLDLGASLPTDDWYTIDSYYGFGLTPGRVITVSTPGLRMRLTRANISWEEKATPGCISYASSDLAIFTERIDVKGPPGTIVQAQQSVGSCP